MRPLPGEVIRVWRITLFVAEGSTRSDDQEACLRGDRRKKSLRISGSCFRSKPHARTRVSTWAKFLRTAHAFHHPSLSHFLDQPGPMIQSTHQAPKSRE